MKPLSQVVDWLELCLRQWPDELSRAAAHRYRQIVGQLASPTMDSSRLWRELPRAIHDESAVCGWAWNGFYVRCGEELQLAPGAVGPPVCATLPNQQEDRVGASGSCWDAILMNQPLLLGDVKSWPGYVSCDGESQLQTVAGVICPVRNGQGEPIAVWDLDSEQPICVSDGLFMSRLMDSLSVHLQPTAEQIMG